MQYKCSICKKEGKELYSLWDRFRLFLFHFFHEDIADLRNEYFTKGYGEGWAAGFKRSSEMTPFIRKSPQEVIENIKAWETK